MGVDVWYIIGEGSAVGFIIGGGIVVGIVAYCIVVVVGMDGIIGIDVLGVIIGVGIVVDIIIGVGIVVDIIIGVGIVVDIIIGVRIVLCIIIGVVISSNGMCIVRGGVVVGIEGVRSRSQAS